MESLKNNGSYEIPQQARQQLSELFYADFCDEAQTSATIKNTFDKYGYLIDTHTAVAQCVYEKYVQATGDGTVSVVVSTANPYKFTQDVLRSVSGETVEDAFEAARKLAQVTGTQIPPQISELREKPVLHDMCVQKDDLISAVKTFLGRMGD